MSLKARHRQLDESVYGAPAYVKQGSTWIPIRKPKTVVWKGIQYTESEGHRKSRDGAYREGGPFFTIRIKPDIHYRMVDAINTRPEPEKYSGPCVVYQVPKIYGDYIANPTEVIKEIQKTRSNEFLDPYGTTAISIIDPLNPHAVTGTALGEIFRDGRLPIPGINLWRQRTEKVRAAGSEYLNAVFGWLPLLNDVKDTMQAIDLAGSIIEDYRNKSGTRVGREFEFPPERSEEESEIAFGSAEMLFEGSLPKLNGTPVAVTRNRKTEVRRWFKGEFTYHAADGKSITDIIRARSESQRLLGTTITPDLLWELTPWSWAVDWFSNASNVIHNIGSFYQAGLVMRYGYMMEETTIVDTYSMPSPALQGVTGGMPSSSITYQVKRRRDANPFGFGLEWEGLSPVQLGIVAALGITRLR